MVRSTLAAAAGAGVDVVSGYAEMVVDVGAGLTEIAVFRDGAVLHTSTFPLGTRDLQPSGRTPAIAPAEIAHQVACVWRTLPEDVQVETIESGLVLTGGGAAIPAIVEAMAAATRLTVRVAADPTQAVIRGLAQLAQLDR